MIQISAVERFVFRSPLETPGWSVLVRQGIATGEAYDSTHIQQYASAIESMVGEVEGTDSWPPKLCRDLRSAGGALADFLLTINQTIDPEAILLAGSMSRIPDYVTGIEQRLRKLGDNGETTRAKLRVGEIRAERAAAILVLLEKVYSPNLDLAAFQDRSARGDKPRVRAGESS